VTLRLGGHVAPGWEPVRDALARNLTSYGDIGAAACVYRDGRPVVDLWGGLADANPTGPRAWAEDTVGLVFSSTKGVTAICAHLLVQQGLLDLDAPVAHYWPEFASAGKAAIPVRWVMSHRAGLPAVTAKLTLDEVFAWEPVVEAIAAQAPLWEPGTAHGYHARTYGWIMGEIVRRITGKSLGRFLADTVAAPLGLDFWVGLPDDQERRTARLYPPVPDPNPNVQAAIEAFMGPDTLLGQVLSGPSGLFAYNDMWNTRPLHACEMPSSNGIGSARSLARLYASTIGPVDGVRLLDEATVRAACQIQSDGPDEVLTTPTRFGLGFMLPPTLGIALEASAPRAFGHPGAGGSLGFADPDAGIGFAYVMNQMQLGLTGDRRSTDLVEAVYGCLASAG
jgi:CubicO group peptidase (beta-lactamase class C family)